MVEQLLGTSKIYEVNFASERKIRDFPLSARILLSKIRERKEFGTNSLQRAKICYPKIREHRENKVFLAESKFLLPKNLQHEKLSLSKSDFCSQAGVGRGFNSLQRLTFARYVRNYIIPTRKRDLVERYDRN